MPGRVGPGGNSRPSRQRHFQVMRLRAVRQHPLLGAEKGVHRLALVGERLGRIERCGQHRIAGVQVRERGRRNRRFIQPHRGRMPDSEPASPKGPAANTAAVVAGASLAFLMNDGGSPARHAVAGRGGRCSGGSAGQAGRGHIPHEALVPTASWDDPAGQSPPGTNDAYETPAACLGQSPESTQSRRGPPRTLRRRAWCCLPARRVPPAPGARRWRVPDQPLNTGTAPTHTNHCLG